MKKERTMNRCEPPTTSIADYIILALEVVVQRSIIHPLPAGTALAPKGLKSVAVMDVK